MPVQSVVDREFQDRVLHSDEPVLVAFRASWCTPSQELVPIIDEITAEFGDPLRVVAVDAEGDTAVIRRTYKVNRLPVTMLFDHGRCVDFIGGRTSKDAIVDMLQRRLKPVLDVDESNFDNEVLRSRIPVLVHFDASWCSPSQALVPVVDQITRNFEGRAKIVRVAFGPETVRLCARYGVQRVPTLTLFVDGEIEDQIFGGMVGATEASNIGLTSADNVTRMLEPFIL